jgi:hypothetical protein
MSTKIEVIEVHKYDQNFVKAVDLLTSEYDNKNRGGEYWIDRFTKSNKLDKIGFLLKVNGVLCGFLGIIGSDEIKGLSVWYVNPEYRRFSIDFLSIALSRLNGQLVNSSANPTAFRVFRHLGFSNFIEYIGIPKKLFGWLDFRELKVYNGNKYFVVYSENCSLIQLVYLVLSRRKLGFFIAKADYKLIKLKEINVLIKGGDYLFPMSIYGDRYE